jgi:hypothetical protein
MAGAVSESLGRPATLPLGAPTSVGSLPHQDRDAAIAFVLDHTPELPAAPTLPGVEPLELMIPQGLWGVPGVDVGDDGSFSVPDPNALDPAAPLGDRELADRPFTSWREFLGLLGGREDPIKLQLTGPITLGLALVDAGVPAGLAFAVAGNAVSLRAGDLLDLADRLAPGIDRVLVFDEPGLVGGLRPDLPLPGEQVVDVLSGALASVEHRCLTGVHVCGPADWRLVLQAGPGLLSLPVGADVLSSAGALGAYLERGGWIAWGAVPTDGPFGEKASRYWRQLSSQWCELVQSGCDPVLLRRQALVTPVCGLALHEVRQAEFVFELCREIAERIHDQVTGIRLSVGA